MKTLLVLVALATGLISHAYGQTYPGQFPANTVFGNALGSTAAPVPGQVTNSQMANMAASSAKCNNTTSSAAPIDCTVAQTKALMGGISISPTDPAYGAKCDGSTDDSTAFQNALNAIASGGGGTLKVPGATCLAHGLTWSSANGLVIEGNGVATILQQNSTTVGLFSASAGTVIVQNLRVIYPTLGSVNANVRFFTFTGTVGYLFNLQFNNGADLAVWQNGAGGGADFITAIAMTGNGFIVDVSFTAPPAQQFGNMRFTNLYFQGTANTTGIGLAFISGDGMYISNSVIAGFFTNVSVQGNASHSYIANLLFDGVSADGAGGPTSTNGAWNFDGTNQFTARIQLSNCWGSAMTASMGLFAANVYTIDISNSIFLVNGTYGILISTGVRDFRLSHSVMSGNSQSSSNTYDGVFVGSGANNIHLEFNRSGPTYVGTSHAGGFVDSQRDGINISSNTVTNYSVIGNDLTGNLTSGLADSGGGTAGTTKNVTLNITGAAIP